MFRRYWSLAVGRLLRRWRSHSFSRSSCISSALAAILRCDCLKDAACRFFELYLYVISRSSAISWIYCSRSLRWSRVFWCFTVFDLHVAWSAISCGRRRSTEFGLAIACAVASRAQVLVRSTGSMISSILHLVASLFLGIWPDDCVSCRVPCPLR